MDQIVNMYRCENLHKGAQKIDKEDVERYSQEPGNLVYSQDEIYCNSDDLKCYNKVVLVRNDIVKNDNAIWRNNINFLSLSNLDLATRPGEFRFKYCKSYIAVYYMLTVTLWSGMKEVIQVPKEDKLPPFIDSKNEVHYRLRFKSIPFAR